MKIYIGSDHAGKAMRRDIFQYLDSKADIEVFDCGTNKDVANYVTEGIKVAENVAMDEGSFGILLCASGIGISIAANKVKGIRAALVHEIELARLARAHNNANIIAMGAKFTDLSKAKSMIDTFLETEFENGRHGDRVNSLLDYEESCLDC